MYTIDDLQEIGNRHGLQIYNMLWRNAGVAVQWYNWRDGGPSMEADPEIDVERQRRGLQPRFMQHLVVARYYPTFQEAIDGEINRLLRGTDR